MHFRNSGAKVNGSYLVCDRGRRHVGCTRVRWPYAHFEAAFLTFVTEVDIKSLTNEFIHKDELSKIRHELEALKGRLSEVIALRDRIARMLTGNEATSYLPDQFHEADRLVADTTQDINELEKRQQELKAENRAYAVGGHNMSSLTEMVGANDGEQARQLRNRLRKAIFDVVECVSLSAGGRFVPVEMQERVRNALVASTNNPNAAKNIHFSDTINEQHRQFSVRFRDGHVRTVRPDFKDPTKFQWIGDGDHDPITRKQVDEMAPGLGYDPAVPEEFDQAFVQLRKMSRQNTRDEQ